jgi:hypothetical protein
MKQGFSAGCGIEVTLKIMPGEKVFEFVKPSYYAGVTEEWETEEQPGYGHISEEQLLERIKTYHKSLRRIVEDEIDIDIYDIKEVKLYAEILNRKGA